MRDDLVRNIVENALDRIVAGERGDRVLDRSLRDHKDLTSDERRRVAERTLGIALWRGRLERMAGGDRRLWYPLFLADREKLEIEGDPRIAAALATPEPDDPVEALAFRRSLPQWLAKRWIEQFGTEAADALATATNERGPVCVRANTLRTSREELSKRLNSEGVAHRASALAPHGLVFEGRPNILGLGAWRDGWFEVQDEASQLVSEALAARPGQLVVDLCAGSGGKTLALAADLRNTGKIVAIDVDPRRMRDLGVRLGRAGVTCVETRFGDARDPSVTRDLEGLCDAVLVDAPCSELGVLRRSPDARWRLPPDAPDAFAPLQRELLARAAVLVRPGGRVVYATCSVDRAENEDVTRSPPPPLRLEHARALRPDLDGSDGFYIASLLADGSSLA